MIIVAGGDEKMKKKVILTLFLALIISAFCFADDAVASDAATEVVDEAQTEVVAPVAEDSADIAEAEILPVAEEPAV